MKQFSFIFIIFLLASCQSKYRFLYQEELDHRMVKLEKHNIWVSKYETTQIEYNAFLKDIQSKDSYPLEDCKIHSDQWVKKIPDKVLGPMGDNYDKHSVYDYYPVVNISTKGAEYFCQWLSENYHKNNLRTYEKVKFRLPTKEEFASLMEEVVIKYDSDNKKEYPSFDFNLKFQNDYAADGAMFTLRVHLKPQTYSGLCSVVGNVSELLAGGTAMGGNWDTFPSEVEQSIDYSTPDPRIGFRIVMEVLEE